MEIECQGCLFTLCSFVCMTEDLSQILNFLWRHGCLRRSYLCEKCGRKCAMGDKDLFFRCNRNTLETPIQNQGTPGQSNQQIIAASQQTQSQIQNNSDGHVLHHQIDQIGHQQYMLLQPGMPELNQSARISSLHNPNTDNLLLINRDGCLQHPGLLQDQSCHRDSVNVTVVPTSVLNHSELNQTERTLTVIDSQGNKIIHSSNGLISSDNIHSIPILQNQAVVAQASTKVESMSDEPLQKIPKKTAKQENIKSPKKRCNFKVSMKKGTFFEKSKLPLDTVLKFIVFWCCMKHPTQEFLRNELSLATRTVVDWSTACREICVHWAKSVSEKIGGDGVMVQIDEVKIQENKENKTDNGDRFSFWGMEKDKEKGKIFIVPVPACDSWSLLTVVNDWILPGSVIISNCWKAYDCLKLQEFIQQTIVQSKTFVHPQNNAGQQNFDGKIDEAGASAGGELQMPRFGTRRSHHLGDLAEFMFKRRYSNHLERMHAFFKQISLAFPLR